LPEVLDLNRARTLDKVLSGDESEDDRILGDLLQKRSKSILAHGLEPIEGRSAVRFLKYVDEVVDSPRVSQRAQHAQLREL
jgi:hypothetical protein